MPGKIVVLRRWQAVGVVVLLTLSYVVAIVLVNRESRMRTSANRDLIVAQAQLLKSQANQRAEITLTTCLDQNGRHDKTIERLDQLIEDAVKANPERAPEIRQSRASTVFIIEALQPHQPCRQIVLDRFGFVPDIS